MSSKRRAEARSGAAVLSLLATSPNAFLLRSLAERPSTLGELQGLGVSPASTLRARLRELIDAAAVLAHHDPGRPRLPAVYELSTAGRELLPVAEALGRWLEACPLGGRSLGGEGGKAAVGALTAAWSATMLRALAVRPLSVAELDSLIVNLSYPHLERRIAAMRFAGQVEARPAAGRETPYGATDWLRAAAAPLLAAIRWERAHSLAGSAPVAGLDVEALFLLAGPLARLESGASGKCRLAVVLSPSGNGGHGPVGVVARLRDGSVASCSSRLDGATDAWASGSLGAWLAALLDDDTAALELGGDSGLARDLVDALHATLFERERGVARLGTPAI